MIDKKFSMLLLILPVIIGFVAVILINPSPRMVNNNPAVIVVRVDDVQDYAFKEAQLFLLNHCKKTNYPLSLAIIPSYFGHDEELVDIIKQVLVDGSEISVHGLEHENLSLYSYDEQKIRLIQAKEKLFEVFGEEFDVLVPPMFSYNNETVRAMEETGFNVVSGLTEFHEKQWLSEKVQSIPATVELCNFSNNSWFMKEPSAVLFELKNSVEKYGYAIIVTHPQEFMTDNELNLDFARKYEDLIKQISDEYNFCSIESLENL